jgi:ABC-type transporter Mla MlaB component
MIRLDCEGVSDAQATLRVAGRIAGNDVDILAAQLHQWLAACDRVEMDLDGVEQVDASGLRLLHSYSSDHLTLRGGSAYLRALMSHEGLLCAPLAPDSGKDLT